MSTVRKYNKQNNTWESIASTDATEIYTSNPLLTGDSTQTRKASVESILTEEKTEIELLKKNVSWLALHGGGGYGGGGNGSSAVNARVVIINPVNGSEDGVTEILWADSINFIQYKIKVVSSSSPTYRVTVRVDGQVVYSDVGVPKNTTKSIPRTALNIRKTCLLSIFAVDENDNEFSTSCTILVPEVKLKIENSDITITRSQLQTQNILVPIKITTSLIGRYKLLYSTKQIVYQNDDFVESGSQVSLINSGIDFESTTTSEQILNFSVTEPKEGASPIIDPQSNSGTYTINFYLVNENNYNIFSNSVKLKITLIETNGLTIIPGLGETEDSRYSIPQDGTLSLSFRVISETNIGVYSYEIYSSPDCTTLLDRAEGIPLGTTRISSITIKNFFTEDDLGEKTLLIKAWNINYPLGTTANVYLLIRTPSAARVEKYLENITNGIIFDFTSEKENFSQEIYNSGKISYTNNQYTSSGIFNTPKTCKANLNIYNRGVDSKYFGFYFSLNHWTYGIITPREGYRWFPMNLNDSNCYLPSQGTANSARFRFTIDIAYSIGKLTDPEATIFHLGDVTKNSTGDGIKICAHKYYVRIASTWLEGEIQDNSFVHLVFAVDLQYEGNGSITVYKNGVYHQVAKVTSSEAYNLGRRANSIYLACSSDLKNNTNINVFSVRMFSKCLNIGEVICSYINNYVCYVSRNTQETGKDSATLERLLALNNIRPDSEVINGVSISDTYDFNTGTYTYFSQNELNTLGIPSKLSNLPIPIVYINTSWTLDEFKRTRPIVEPDESATFIYKPEGGREEIKLGQNGASIKLSIQGTSTTNYEIKNVSIEFQNDLMFSPSETWFPETNFTLKADVVDSGHINNAVIGKFVNDCYSDDNNDTFMNSGSGFPIKSRLKELQTSSLPKTLTPKVNIEGFPVLLIMRFKGQGSVSKNEILGIYSFNLGRESKHNLGFSIPKFLRDTSGQELAPNVVSFPGFFHIPQPLDYDTKYTALCFEGKSSSNSTTTEEGNLDDPTSYYYDSNGEIVSSITNYDLFKVNNQYIYPLTIERDSEGYIKYGNEYVLDSEGLPIQWNNDTVKKIRINPDGYFWSPDSSFSGLWDKKYPQADPVGLDSSVEFQKLCTSIATELPYSKGYVRRGYNSILNKYVLENMNPGSDGSSDIAVTRQTNETFSISYPQVDNTPIAVSVKNTSFYYVVSLLFGLFDSFGKNLQVKAWIENLGGNNFSTSYLWSPSFYDMDTALGLDNLGSEKVLPNMMDYSITNSPNSTFLEIYSDIPQAENKVVTVYSNKLWGAISDPVTYEKYSVDYDCAAQPYALTWKNIRNQYLLDVDEFVDKYFNTQLSNCSQFLINYDFKVKYVDTSQLSMLHGTRLDFIRNWLKKRVIFLDSILDPGTSGQYLNDINLDNLYEIPYNGTVTLTHNSGSLLLPVVTNTPVIITSHIGNDRVSKTYVPENTETTIRVAFSKANDIQTTINNASCIYELPDLKTIGVTKIISNTVGTALNSSGQTYEDDRLKNQRGAFSSLKRLDLSYTTTLDENLNLFNIFKTWDPSFLGKDPEYFAIEEINLRGIQSQRRVSLDLSGVAGGPKVYENPYRNLVKVDVSDSDVNSVSLPGRLEGGEGGVSLSVLGLRNSTIESLKLEGQPLLSSLDFTGCNNLREISLNSCDKLSTLSLSRGNSKIREINISNCSALTSISINLESVNSYLPSIDINNCKNLTTISILGCSGTYDSSEPKPRVTISDCTHLTTLSLKNSEYTTVVFGDSDSISNLTSLDLSSSRVEHFGVINGGVEPDEINLTDCPNSISALFSGNIYVKKIRYKNEESSPININKANTFSNCLSLERVYGNFIISKERTFASCPNLKLFPDNTFDGVSVRDSNGQWKHPEEIPGAVVTVNGRKRVRFVRGADKTNIYITNSGAQSLFCGVDSDATRYGPDLSNFEIYYVLYNLAASVTSIGGMFESLSNSGRRDFTWKSQTVDNSPHRSMFKNCENVTSVVFGYHTGFWNTNATTGTYFRIFSPTKNSNGEYNDDGLLSPLKKVTSWSYFLFNHSFICDRHIFRLSSGKFFNTTTTPPASPRLVISSDINDPDLSKSDIDSIISASGGNITDFGLTDEQLDLVGNISEIFTSLKKVTTVSSFLANSSCIYKFTSNSYLNLPIETTAINSSFIGAGIGELKLQNLYSSSLNTDVSLKTIDQSFRFPKALSNGPLIFNINPSTFERFSVLTTICGASIRFNDQSLNGYGLKKYLHVGINSKDNLVILDGILSPSNSWERIDGLFRNSIPKIESSSVSIEDKILELPGNVFKNNHCLGLKSVVACFYNIQSKIKLTPKSFEECSQLSDVSYIFGRGSYSTHRDSSTYSSITEVPLKLFYHGESEQSVEVAGTNWEAVIQVDEFRTVGTENIAIESYVEDGLTKYRYYVNYEKIDNSTIRISPITKLKAGLNINNYTQVGCSDISRYTNKQDWPGKTEDLYYFVAPNTSINQAERVFYKQNLPKFRNDLSNSEGALELNPDYFPFKYRYDSAGGEWELAKINTKTHTLMWSYDGDVQDYEVYISNPGFDEIRDNLEYLDELNTTKLQNNTASCRDVSRYMNGSQWGGDTISINQTQDTLFCTPPDIFRYFSKNANVRGFYEGCGLIEVSLEQLKNNYPSTWNYIIPPSSNGYGLKGRICPYLLKPIPNSSNLSSIFRGCTYIGYYSEYDSAEHKCKSYLIPKTFFDYMTINNIILDSSFEGVAFPKYTDLNMFNMDNIGGSSEVTLSLEKTFYNWSVLGSYAEGTGWAINNTDTLISGIFQRVRYSKINNTFAVDTSHRNPSGGSIVFANIFNNKASIISTNSVFRGYVQNVVTHESTKTVSKATSSHNYQWYNESDQAYGIRMQQES